MSRENLDTYLRQIKKSPVKGEYYLTDLIEIANANGLKVGEFSCEYKYIRGVNTKAHLKEVESLWGK
jgi:bifunctional UDP-N-acetylglucosamine pyrophosphorylase/glucosamine-1-phosphate N-acetyltransferase